MSRGTRWSLPLFVAATLFAIGLSGWANRDLSDGRHVLYMDEQLSFDGVKRILHPRDARDFAIQVLDGVDHRYGRIFWNGTALAVAPFERVGGPRAQIIAARWYAALALIAACVILVMTLIDGWPMRALALWLLVLLPSTPYFTTMPRPEAQQMVFIALFLAMASRREFRFGWHWIFLGLAFGAKISVLPAIVLLAALAVFRERESGGTRAASSPAAPVDWADHVVRGAIVLGLLAFVGYALGTTSSTPELLGRYTMRRVLIVAAVLTAALLVAVRGGAIDQLQRWAVARLPIPRARMPRQPFPIRVSPRVKRGAAAAGAFLLGFFIAEPVPLTGMDGVRMWYASTFQNTAHGSDDATVTPLTWLTFMGSEWMELPALVVMAVAMVLGGAFALGVWKLVRDRRWTSPWLPGVVAMTCGAALAGPIIIAVKRVWPIYLHPGVMLLVAGAAAIIERGVRTSAGRPTHPAIRLAIAGLAMFAVLRVPATFEEYRSLAARTRTPAYQRQAREYASTVALYEAVHRAIGRQVRVLGDPMLFTPDSSAAFTIRAFWGPLVEWPRDADLVVVYERMTPDGPLPAAGSANYPAAQLSRVRFAAHVAADGSRCAASPCFRPLPFPEPCVRAFVSDSLYALAPVRALYLERKPHAARLHCANDVEQRERQAAGRRG